MLPVRDETPRDIGKVRMINIAAFDQPDEQSMIPILDPAAMAGPSGIARYRPDRI